MEYRPKYPDSPFIHIADIVNDETGKTYREENSEKVHRIPVGTLVEIVPWDEDAENQYSGVRLFVASHGRDCDQTPLYSLSPDRTDIDRDVDGFLNLKWIGGFGEESLKVVSG